MRRYTLGPGTAWPLAAICLPRGVLSGLKLQGMKAVNPGWPPATDLSCTPRTPSRCATMSSAVSWWPYIIVAVLR